jgi:hypothetical protein
MARLVGGDFDRIFDGFTHTAFRLETAPYYAVPTEDDAYRDFLAGTPFDLSWHQPWLAMIKAATDTGKSVRRVRVMAEPPTPYQTFELTITPHNLDAGEDIRILPSSIAEHLGLPNTEFWIFDETRVVTMLFDQDGIFQYAEITDNPHVAADHRRLRDLAWNRAIPYRRYLATHPLPPLPQPRT